MKILHISPALSGPLGGVPRSSRSLCASLVGAGCEVQMLSVGGRSGESQFSISESFYKNSFSSPRFLTKFAFSRELRNDLPRRCQWADVIHSHGLWTMPSIYAGRAAEKMSLPHVISPRGMLSPDALRYSRYRKMVVWGLAQRSYLERAACIHVTSEQEFYDVRKIGIKGPVSVVPNGVSVNSIAGDLSQESEKRFVLFLGRRHPIKGLELLISAWARVEHRFPQWELKIVGPGESQYDEELNRQIRVLGCENVFFLDSVFGCEKERILGRSQLLVLPSRSENFGLVVAEALVQETPVLASKGTPWSGLERFKCGWWFDQTEDALISVLSEAMSLSDATRSQMGRRGRQWMIKEFGQEATSKKMIETYEWLAGHRIDRPDHVILD